MMTGQFRSGARTFAALVLFAVASVAFAQSTPPAAGASPAAPAAPQAVSVYRLAAGDVISIRVFNEPEFTQERIRLTDAGTISFPILGELPVLGRTVGDLEAVITGRLKGRVLVNPQVTVWIEQYRPFFINGMVERPGAYPFVPGLTVRKAASIAGGFRERASLNKIFVQRETDPQGQKPTRQSVDAEVGPGDTIIVEESFF